MKRHNILTKSALLLLTFVVASYSYADIQVGYIVIRVQYTGDSWQQIEAPKLIPCPKNVGDIALTIDHSILIGYDAANGQVTEFRFPNPRALIGDWGPSLATEVVADIFIPADPGMTYLIFREQHDSAQDSLVIDISNIDVEPVDCNAPEFELLPTPTEVEEEEV
jgi:hypothetical protein